DAKVNLLLVNGRFIAIPSINLDRPVKGAARAQSCLTKGRRTNVRIPQGDGTRMKFTTAIKAVSTASTMVLMMSTAASAVTLQLHKGGDPRTLDPHKASGNWEDRPISDYIEGLMTLDAAA